MKVVFVIPTLDAGGIENYLLRFLHFSKKEINAIVIVRNFKKGVMYEAYSEVCDEIYFAPMGNFNPQKMLAFYRLLSSLKANYVVDFNSNFAGWTMLLSKLAGYENRLTFYRQGKNHFKKSVIKNLFNSFLNKLVYNYSTRILSNSNSSLQFFFPKDFNNSKFEVIYNGLDLNKFNQEVGKNEMRRKLGLPLNSFLIGHSGRLDPLKNQDLILKMALVIQEIKSNVIFVLIGQGTETIQLLSDNVLILGYKKNVNQYLNAFDAFIFPSFSEGQPNALIEAMASGLPILASDIPSIKECIPVEKHKILLSPFDLDGFINGLTNLIRDPDSYTVDYTFVASKFDGEVNFNKFLKSLR